MRGNAAACQTGRARKTRVVVWPVRRACSSSGACYTAGTASASPASASRSGAAGVCRAPLGTSCRSPYPRRTQRCARTWCSRPSHRVAIRTTVEPWPLFARPLSIGWSRCCRSCGRSAARAPLPWSEFVAQSSCVVHLVERFENGGAVQRDCPVARFVEVIVSSERVNVAVEDEPDDLGILVDHR